MRQDVGHPQEWVASWGVGQSVYADIHEGGYDEKREHARG